MSPWMLLQLLLIVPWISGSITKISTECAGFCVKNADDAVTLRAENAMLRSLVKGLRAQNNKIQPRVDSMPNKYTVSLNLMAFLFRIEGYGINSAPMSFDN